jgi:hypothetical protein
VPVLVLKSMLSILLSRAIVEPSESALSTNLILVSIPRASAIHLINPCNSVWVIAISAFSKILSRTIDNTDIFCAPNVSWSASQNSSKLPIVIVIEGWGTGCWIIVENGNASSRSCNSSSLSSASKQALTFSSHVFTFPFFWDPCLPFQKFLLMQTIKFFEFIDNFSSICHPHVFYYVLYLLT